MTRITFTLFLLSLLAGLSLLAQSDSTAILEIEFTGIQTPEGQVGIGINYSPEGFPHEPDVEIQYSKEGLMDGMLTIQVMDLPYGTYAISALDDLDSDIEMKMFLGIPKEAYGFSRNPNSKLRTPKFEECSFELNQAHQKITIHLKHFGKKE